MHVGKWLAGAVCWATLISWAAGAQVLPSSSPDVSALDARVAKRMEDGGMVGVAAALVVDNKIVWMKGHGYAEPA